MEFTQTFKGKINGIKINKGENPGKNKMYTSGFLSVLSILTATATKSFSVLIIWIDTNKV